MSEDNKQKLVDAAIEQMKIDIIELLDVQPIECLLHYLPENVLEGYLSDEEFRDQRVIDALRGGEEG